MERLQDQTKQLLARILANYPDTQAVYRFGSYGTAHERPASDVDVALLLPPEQASQAGNLAMSDLHLDLEALFGRAVDLINLREVSTVFQKEILLGGERIYCSDRFAADEFEMHVLSFYQKLNEERAGIIAEGLQGGRFYDV